MAPSINTNIDSEGRPNDNTNGVRDRSMSRSANDRIERFATSPVSSAAATGFPTPKYELFNENTRAFVYGLQPKAVQGMLDFDFICRRKTPSVAGIIYPFGGQFILKQYWGTKETLVWNSLIECSLTGSYQYTKKSRRLWKSILKLMSLWTLRPVVVPTRLLLNSWISRKSRYFPYVSRWL